jgi:hypothetical protein
MTKKTVLAVCFVLILSLSTFAVAEAQTNTDYQVALEGPTWDHSVITILVLPLYSQPWWNPSYLNATLRAMDQWNEALAYFASNYSDYAYISGVMLAPEVSNSTLPGFDAYLTWVEQFGNETCEAGLTQTAYTSVGVIKNSSLKLSACDCQGNILSEVDMQNVALHELGHCVGLGHANYTDDTMYYAYTLGSPVRALSTLDVYGVATVFRWMAALSQYSGDNQGQPIYSVTLPPSIEYEFMPIPAKDVPSQSTIDQVVTFLNSLTQFVLQPEVLILVILAVAAIAAYSTITRIRRHPIQRQHESPSEKREM